MQSQQKRVKWSRGETAEALEERTDTGITQASVELMENCMPDIYGNISRRPGLKLMAGKPQFTYDEHLQVFPFYITETEYILLAVHYDTPMEAIYVNNGIGTHIGSVTTVSGSYPKTKTSISEFNYAYKPVSYAQQNNYMVIADGYNVYKLQFNIQWTPSFSVTPTLETWKFSAGWYAPNGTSTEQVSSTEVPGMDFDSSSVGNYTYTESNGETTVYSWITTGIASSALNATWTGTTTTYYVHMRSTGHLRADLYISTDSTNAVSSFTMTNGNTYTADQIVHTYTSSTPDYGWSTWGYNVYFRIHNEEIFLEPVFFGSGSGTLKTIFSSVVYNVSLNVTYTLPQIAENIPIGCIVQFPNNGAYMRVEGYDSDGTNLRMYGSFLTPVADDNVHDTIVKIETGYISLQPEQWSSSESYPHPNKLLFLDQRLWAAGWQNNVIYTQAYALVIGSQIARYTDLKNNYNQENEPITLDILTSFKEHIVHLIDYNGLKIMTDSYEYAYENGGVVKQSGNGSLEQCEPLVFESLCLYCDSTGNQIKAMQYEFQSNIFNSSTINTVAPKDLIWYPTSMAAFEDKIYSTGKHLFVVNQVSENHPRVAVCNFVPGNQANIWSRWSFVDTEIVHVPGSIPERVTVNTMCGVVRLKTEPLFLVAFQYFEEGVAERPVVVIPATLDFTAEADCVADLYTFNNINYYAPYHVEGSGFGSRKRTIAPNTEVAVYADGEFKFLTTTGSNGEITADLTGLTNITVGLPINATIRSHPIDVGGKTKSIKKRIGKARMSVHDTEPGAITINGKTGYMNPAKDLIDFYGVTGMKDEIKYTITNNNGAMFHLESLLMNIEYGTLDS